MGIWLILGTLSVCAAALVMLPFSSKRKQEASGTTEIQLHAQQLSEIDREEKGGDIDPDVAAGERVRVSKQILASNIRQDAPLSSGSSRQLGIGIAVVVILGAIATFAETGGFKHSDSSGSAEIASMNAVDANVSKLAEPLSASQSGLPDVDTMIAKLAERLKTAPRDADGWKMLGWSYFETKHYPKAVESYRHAIELKPASAAYQSAYGEAQVFAADGTVTDNALKAFSAALSADPNDEASHYYVGLAKSQKGDTAGALREWNAALAKSSGNSKWGPRLREQISLHTGGVKSPSNIRAPMEEARPPSPPSQMQDQAMPAQDRQAFISNMVEGLDQKLRQNPNDPDGWMRLIRSRLVLQQPDLAKDALSRALAAYQNDKAMRQRIASTALALGVTTK